VNCSRLVMTGVLAFATVVAMPSRVAAQDSTRSPIRKRTMAEDLQMFGQVLNQIRVNHPDSLDTHELLMAAIQGMVRAADPHSYVIPAIRLDPAKEAQLRDGKLQPIPVSFVMIGGAPVVSGVAAGTAASSQDILPGDELISADKKNIVAESAEELEISLAGPKNSAVVLEFERRRQDGSLARIVRNVKRERADDASAVPVSIMLDSATGYVRITTFMGAKVADDLHSALERLEKAGMKQLLLDLRDNGGGSVDEAARIAGEFLPSGATVYTSVGSKKEVTDTGKVKRSFWRNEKRYPIVVMINSGTASASELVAGALQDHDRALVFGQPSFGKSLLMRGFPLADGSAIVLVVGHINTPCGRAVQRQYRSITTRDYYRLARAERDTVGRPSCKTDGGRTVYGGGGIYPDVVAPRTQQVPRWVSQVVEQELTLGWVGGFIAANAPLLTTLDQFVAKPALPSSALTDFRAYAEKQGVRIPTGAADDVELQRLLVSAVARGKWGDAGFYRAEALLDDEIKTAMSTFRQAAAFLQKAK
jgi:carboxyl-terminal processing protease